MLVKWKKIPLTQGKFAIVDPEDYDRLMAMGKWHTSCNGYACRTYNYKNQHGLWSGKTIFLHSLVLDVPEKYVIDHINGVKTDNRKSNLRVCTRAENGRNRGKQENNTSGYKGVSYKVKNKKFSSQIKVYNKQIYIGLFDTPIEAARAYNEAAIKYHGEFAKLNEL